MAILDLFSKRQKRARGQISDVYQYADISRELRVQVIHIVNETLGDTNQFYHGIADPYREMHTALCKELGVFQLRPESNSAQEAIFNFLLEAQDREIVLSVIEVLFQKINAIQRGVIYPSYGYGRSAPDPGAAIAELNSRFKEHAVGYQFESGKIIRVDSEFIHTGAVHPALTLLHDEGFAGANEEFLSAHNHYRHQRPKECLVDCLKAFESTMKAVCDKRGWGFEPGSSAKKLIEICVQNGLFASFHQSQFGSLRSLLESGVPTVRNNLGGHGQGSRPIVVPMHLARFALNLTAANILFLIESERNLP